MNQIKELTEESTKKYLKDNISKRLLEFMFEKNKSIISEAEKYVVKKYCLQYKTWKVIVWSAK